MAGVCKKCGSVDTEKRLCPDTSPHYSGLYCKDCGTWIKWLSKPKVRNGYAVIHIVSGVMEACEVFTAPEGARRRLEEILDEIWDEGGWEEWFEDHSVESGSTILRLLSLSTEQTQAGGKILCMV